MMRLRIELFAAWLAAVMLGSGALSAQRALAEEGAQPPDRQVVVLVAVPVQQKGVRARTRLHVGAGPADPRLLAGPGARENARQVGAAEDDADGGGAPIVAYEDQLVEAVFDLSRRADVPDRMGPVMSSISHAPRYASS